MTAVKPRATEATFMCIWKI